MCLRVVILFTGVLVIQAAQQMQEKSVWSGCICFFVFSWDVLQHVTEKSEIQIHSIKFP